MNQADLTERSDALQERLLILYESDLKTLAAQLEHWTLIRKQYVLYYYAKKEGYTHLGLQPLPNLQISEYRAKEAIQLMLLIKSLQKSPFANEQWTLTETSAEIIHTPPKNCFKKQPYIVTVWFDHNPDNSFPYTNWDFIYYQDDNEQWHKTPGLVDINGMYYVESNGDRAYFQLFDADAERYGTTGQWTVKVKNETFSTSSYRAQSVSPQASISSSSDSISSSQTVHTRRQQIEEGSPSSSTAISTTTTIRRRRRQREYSTDDDGEPSRSKRRREASAAGVPASQVGRRHRSVPTTGLTRLARLEAEARDPAIVIVKGGSNQLKCWRYRIGGKYKHLFKNSSTVFKWTEHNNNEIHSNRLLIAFESYQQRKLFLQKVSVPKGATYAYGNLDSL
jgi:hypothetical protein